MTEEITFLGEHSYSLDSQRRVSIPKVWRQSEGRSVFYLLPGRDRCLQLISEEIFSDLKKKIRQVSFTNPKVSRALAKLGAMAQECVCDKQGRISLSAKLKSYAGIDSDIVLIGAITTAQLWAKGSWEELNNDDPDALLDVIDGLFASDNSNDLMSLLSQ